MSSKQMSSKGNNFLHLEEEEHRNTSNQLSYSTMVAKMEEEEQIQPHSEHPSAPEFYEILQNQEQDVSRKHFDSAGPPRVNRPVHVPFEQVLKNSEPSHQEKRPGNNLPRLPPKNLIKHNSDNTRKYSEPTMKIGGAKSFTGFGDRIVKSVLKKEEKPQTINQVIEEGSAIMSDSGQTSSISHFEPVKFESDEQANQNNLFVILTSQAKEKPQGGSDSPIELRQTGRRFQEAPVKDAQANENSQQSFKIVNAVLKNDVQQSPNIVVSRIIRKFSQEAAIMKPIAITQKEPEGKMVHTYGPRVAEPQYKIQANGGSQPTKRSPSKQPSLKNKNMFYNFQSERDQSIPPAERNSDYNEIIKNKMNELMNMLSKQTQKGDEYAIKAQLANAFSHQFNLHHQIPSRKKIQDINKLVPGDIFHNISEINNQEQKQIKTSNPHEKGFFLNCHQQIPIRENDIPQHMRYPQTIRPGRPHRLAINYKDYSQNPTVSPVGRALHQQKKTSKTTRREEEEGYTISDEEFEQVERSIPNIPRPPKIKDQVQTLTELGIQAFESLDVKPDDYHYMDLSRTRQGVVFDLKKGPYIIWEYQGRFFFGHRKGRKNYSALQRQGQGIQIIPGVSFFEGQFSRGMKNGYGVSIKKNGEKYRGYWKNDLPHGTGKLCTNASRYEGDFVGGVKQGEGFQLFSNGDSYDGTFFENKFHGFGKYVWKNTTFYEGDFKKHYMDGQGYWQSANGDTYEGQYYRSMKHGWGKYRWSNGRIFQGRFEHGHRVDSKSGPKMTIAVQKQLTCDLGSFEESERYEVQMDRMVNKRYTIREMNSISQDRKSPRRTFFRQI